MTGHFSVKNFERFQHYKNRNPPWIRLYNSLLDDYEYGLLPDASKAHLSAIWLLASRYDNKIPFDAEWVGRRINANSVVDLENLALLGFIIPDQSCSNVLADRKHDASKVLSQSRVEERREETEKRYIEFVRTNSHSADAEKNLELLFGEKPKTKKPNGAYPQTFEETWNNYRALATAAGAEAGSKRNAYEKWKRLSPQEQLACDLGVMAYTGWRIDRSATPGIFTAPPKHFERFITGRMWETYQMEPAT